MKRMKYFAFALLVGTALFARSQARAAEYCDQPDNCRIEGCPQWDCYCDTDVNKCLPVGASRSR